MVYEGENTVWKKNWETSKYVSQNYMSRDYFSENRWKFTIIVSKLGLCVRGKHISKKL